MKTPTKSFDELKRLVEEQQAIQKRHPPTAPEWRRASRRIHQLVAEHERRVREVLA